MCVHSSVLSDTMTKIDVCFHQDYHQDNLQGAPQKSRHLANWGTSEIGTLLNSYIISRNAIYCEFNIHMYNIHDHVQCIYYIHCIYMYLLTLCIHVHVYAYVVDCR